MIHSRHSFTLLELLLVVFLLAALAASAVTLTDEIDLQARHELTVSRREQIRSAVLGDPERAVHGAPLLTGFVSDMGRLPVNLLELLEPPLDDDGQPVGWQVVEGIGRGWRGPYLQADFEGVDGPAFAPVFRDGWGTRGITAAEDTANFGWDVSSTAGLFGVRSFGRDGAEGGLEVPDADFPGPLDAGDPTSPAWLVRPTVWQLDLSHSTHVVRGVGGGGATDELYLELWVPAPEEGASGDGWLDIDPAGDDSLQTTPVQNVDRSSGSWEATFSFGAPDAPTEHVANVPAGVRGLALRVVGEPDPVHVWPLHLAPGAAPPSGVIWRVP